jgi:hypothetical protein
MIFAMFFIRHNSDFANWGKLNWARGIKGKSGNGAASKLPVTLSKLNGILPNLSMLFFWVAGGKVAFHGRLLLSGGTESRARDNR